jgi:hypothetical protein
MNKLFYKNVDEGLKKELEYRKYIFSNKTDDFYNFMSAPYVKITFKRRFDGKEYTINNSDKKDINSIYDLDFKNIPNPIFSSLSVYNEGRYGSIRKADITIKLNHINQLNDLESYLLIPGNTVIIEFGLSKYANKLNDKNPYYNLKLEEKIFNFKYSYDGSGGIEFTINAMGEGHFISSLDLNTKIQSDVISLDKTKEEENRSNNLLSYIYSLIDNLSQPSFSGYDENTGICRYRVSPTWKYETNDDFDSSNNEYIWYITLNGFISIINNYIIKPRKSNRNILYNGNAISSYDENVISADPTEIVFPDKNMGKYNKIDDLIVSYANFGEIPELNKKFKHGNNINLGYMLISIDLISDIFEEITNEDEEENVPIRKFFNKLFNSVYENSGNIYDLTLIIKENKNDEVIDLEIVDSNYIDDSQSNNKPYVFETMNPNNILKTFSIESELPDKMSTAMYIGGSTSKNINPKIYSFFTRDGESYYDPNIPNPFYTVEEWEKLKNDQKIQDIKKDIQFYSNKISKNGVENNIKNSLRSALKSYKNLNTDAKWNNNLMYPLTLQITLNGIIGFQFGDIITIDYLPKRYLNHKDVKIVFMVTKINHSIEGNEWETSLETQCRIRS